jgi:hypothetical protein
VGNSDAAAVFGINATFSEVCPLSFWGTCVAAPRGGALRQWQQPVVSETQRISEEYEGVSRWLSIPGNNVIKKLIVDHLVNKVYLFIWNVFIKAQPWSLSWARWILSTSSHPFLYGI